MTAPAVDTIDFDAVFADITARLEEEKEHRLIPPLIRVWDGDWNLRAIVKQERVAKFPFLLNDAGIGQLDLPADYFVSEWLIDVDERATTSVFVTVDKDGARWSGRLTKLQLIEDEDDNYIVRCTFTHDFSELRHILCYANPWLLPELQFPKLWLLWGRSRWCVKTTAWANIFRLKSNIWTIPPNPMDPASYLDLDMRNWSIVVKPDLTPDTSVSGLVYSRFKTLDDATKKVMADAQLTWDLRRYLEGDEPPWPGAQLRSGTLVVDVIENSAWNTGTSFGGNVYAGLKYETTNIGPDGWKQTVDEIPDPNMPTEYYQPGFRGTVPQVPGVIFYDSEHGGIKTAEWSWEPAGPVGIVAGGSSMPGVNEGLSASIRLAGSLASLIPGVPDLGSVADALLAPIYSNVFLAFGKWINNERRTRLGWSHLHERFQEGSDKAYTIAWLLAMRTGQHETREKSSHLIVVEDGASGWRVGQRGFGHFFIGDRVGSNIRKGKRGRIFIDRVTELTLSWSRDQSPVWEIVVGEREPEDPLVKAFQEMMEILGLLRDLGVL